MSEVHLACGGSPEYLPHAAAMIHSVLEHSPGRRVHVHYLHGPSLPRRQLDRLRTMGEIHPIEVPDERIAPLPARPFLPATMWYRTFLPELLPDVPRVLYLDADTIAVDDLSELWALDLGDDLLAAVTNVWEPWNVHLPALAGVPDGQPYFNSGVVWMDLDGLREEDAIARVHAHAVADPGRLRFGDQDALNVVLGHRRLALAPRWNVMNSVLYFEHAAEVLGADAVADARERPGIRHFEGPAANKPWHLLCERESRAEYMRHRAATPWPRVRRQGLTPGNLARYAARRVRA